GGRVGGGGPTRPQRGARAVWGLAGQGARDGRGAGARRRDPSPRRAGSLGVVEGASAPEGEETDGGCARGTRRAVPHRGPRRGPGRPARPSAPRAVAE